MPPELDAAYVRRIRDGMRIVSVRLDDAPVPLSLAGLHGVQVDPDADWSAQFELIMRALTEPRGTGPFLPGPPAQSGALRRMLGDPSRWIEAYDLVTRTTDAVVEQLAEDLPGDTGDLSRRVRNRLARYDELTAVLAEVLARCGYFGDPGQLRLWTHPLQRVRRTALPARGCCGAEVWERLAWYPALRLAYAIGVAAVAGGREGLLLPLLTQQVVTSRGLEPSWRTLAPHRVVDAELVRAMPNWTGSRDALSIHLRTTLRPAFVGILAEDEFAESFERFEYLRSLLELHLSGGRSTSLGEFAWSVYNRTTPLAGRIAAEVDALGPSWPLLRAGAFGGSVPAFRHAQAQLHDCLRRRFY
jgi:hypothetical protein